MIYFLGNPQIGNSSVWKPCSLKFCQNYFAKHDFVQVDTETNHNKRVPEFLPNPYESKVICYQLGDNENQFVIDTSVYPLKTFKYLFEDEKIVKIFVNAFFDLRFFFHENIRIKNIYDCFLAEMLLTLGQDLEKGYRGLEQMALRYCKVQLNKEVRGQIHWRGLDDTVIKYAAEDVMYLEKIMNEQVKLIKRDNLTNALKLENRYIITLARMSYNGFKLDPVKWIENCENNKRKLKDLKEELNNWIIQNKHYEFTNSKKSGILFSDYHLCTINWKSAKQVLPLLKKLGINTKTRDKETGKDKDSVDLKLMYRQKHKSTLLPIYIKYKELEKEIDTYGEDFVREHFNPISGRIHSEYFPLLESGRISSNNPKILGDYIAIYN